MIKLTKYALSLPALAKVMATRSITVQLLSGESAMWKNTNLLLDPASMFYLPGTIGAKTGTTPNAGCCLISAVKKNGKTYICAVMGCYADSDRYIASRAMLQTIG
jgi:D-alanyl-D-alanine carboxypeptidase (penicillin-binding protein 5/6)